LAWSPQGLSAYRDFLGDFFSASSQVIRFHVEAPGAR
jgi:hypothetical protein